MIPQIEDQGASYGKRAAELYKKREREGTHEAIRRALPSVVRAAKADAATRQASEQERAIAIFWESAAAAFEEGIKN